ncbi:MAG: hypothetical protein ACM3UU_01430 [Ignavibacteriales bacterium]
MDINNFKGISLNGRVAYGISCFENTLLFLKYDVSNWKMILELLWDFTSTENLEAWNDQIAEVIPENLLEFKTYEQHDFEYLEESQFEYLYNLYQNIDNRIGILIRQIFYLGSSHSYSVIVDHGQRSLEELDRIITFMIDNSIPLPDIELFKRYSIDENKGWGNKFDGTKLSKIL